MKRTTITETLINRSVITPPFIRITQLNQPKDALFWLHLVCCSIASFRLPPCHSDTYINCWQNLPETQTHRNAENFLENYFVIVYNASPVVTNSKTCSMFVFISLNVMCPTKANDVNGYTYYKTYVCRALSIACTHNHPFAEVAAPTMPT